MSSLLKYKIKSGVGHDMAERWQGYLFAMSCVGSVDLVSRRRLYYWQGHVYGFDPAVAVTKE